jgi:hypothetical protein
MKPINLAAQLAAAETELGCVRVVFAHVKLDRDIRQERDDWDAFGLKTWEELIALPAPPPTGPST